MTTSTQAHWDHIYETKAGNELSWFQEHPAISLDLIRATGAKPGAAIVDIAGGASRLVDALLDEGFHATVLDLSESALAAAKARLGPRSAKVAWIIADVTAWAPAGTYDLWHDRAAFHFLTETPAAGPMRSAWRRPCGPVATSSSAHSRRTDRNRAAVFPSCGMTGLQSAPFWEKGSRSSTPAAMIM